jgi:uncharacterized Fe-S cluster-containing radical SAM superfamily protein
MAKPVGPICNLDCKYCFYLEKENLYGKKSSWAMPEDVLESYIRQFIEAQDSPVISFAWQGGEPTILGVEYFRRAIELQKKYANGKKIENAFQTNGILLDDPWGEFLAANHFLVGISIDGPSELHDAYRVDKGGQPSFNRVMRGLDFLKKHGVKFNTLTAVQRKNSYQPLGVYRFLKEIGSGFMQFIPIVEWRGSRTSRVPKASFSYLRILKKAPAYPSGLWNHDNMESSSVRFSMSGFVMTWVSISCNCLTSRWRVGWVWNRAFASSDRLAVKRWQWNTMATSTPATITSTRKTSLATSWRSRWKRWRIRPNRHTSVWTNGKRCRATAANAKSVLPATVSARSTVSSARRMAKRG